MKFTLLNKRLDFIQAALLLFSEVEYLYEFSEIFSREDLDKFLSIFAGQVIRVPSEKELNDKLRDIDVWSRLKQVKYRKEINPTSKFFKNVFKELMDKTGLSRKELRAIFSEVDSRFLKLGVAFGEV